MLRGLAEGVSCVIPHHHPQARRRLGKRTPPSWRGLTRWEVLRYVAQTRLGVTHAGRPDAPYADTIGKYRLKAAAINLQYTHTHTPLSVHCLGIFMSHRVDAFLLKRQFFSFISWLLILPFTFWLCIQVSKRRKVSQWGLVLDVLSV